MLSKLMFVGQITTMTATIEAAEYSNLRHTVPWQEVGSLCRKMQRDTFYENVLHTNSGCKIVAVRRTI